MANQTDYMGLSLPLGSDSPDIKVINRNFATIDATYRQEHEERVNADVDLAAAIAAEQKRAQAKETELDNSLKAEISRAKKAESDNKTEINAEISRAKQEEKTLTENLNSEVERATNAETECASALSGEISRATLKETEIEQSVQDERTRALAAEGANLNKITEEISRAKQEEKTLTANLNKEIERSKAAEEKIADDLTTHLQDKSNPHGVTKEQVGLGNVPNVSTNNQTPTYEESATLSALTNGETLETAFGKIAKAIRSLISHIANKDNPHGVTAAQIGLDKVENTPDKNKPVSTAQQAAIDAAYANSNAYTDQKISELIGGAPETLDTLKEIADAFEEHKSVEEALNTAIGEKASQKELDTHTGNENIHIKPAERTAWTDASTKKHAHENKTILDAITQAIIDKWNLAYEHISDKVKHITTEERTAWTDANSKKHSHSNKAVLDGITAEKIASWDAGTDVEVDSTLSESSTNPIQNKAVYSALKGKANSTHTHPYAGSASAGGAANSANKWATARNINGMSVDGLADRANYGTCSTAASTAAKTVACAGYVLKTGAEVAVKFSITNTAASPTLNVNSTGAKPIYYRGAAIGAGYLAANRTYTFRYNGTQYDLVGDLDTNTTYSNMAAATSGAAGKSGLVPAPAAGAQAKFLRGDGTWQTPTNTTYSTGNASTAGVTKLYTGTGTATDGAMTQAAITQAINAMVEVGADITV